MIDQLTENSFSSNNPIQDPQAPADAYLKTLKVIQKELKKSQKPKHKSGKKHGKHKSKRSPSKKQAYAELAYQYGVVSTRYDMLEQMVKLAIAAKRGCLDDQLLDSGLAALESTKRLLPPKV